MLYPLMMCRYYVAYDQHVTGLNNIYRVVLWDINGILGGTLSNYPQELRLLTVASGVNLR